MSIMNIAAKISEKIKQGPTQDKNKVSSSSSFEQDLLSDGEKRNDDKMRRIFKGQVHKNSQEVIKKIDEIS